MRCLHSQHNSIPSSRSLSSKLSESVSEEPALHCGDLGFIMLERKKIVFVLPGSALIKQALTGRTGRASMTATQ